MPILAMHLTGNSTGAIEDHYDPLVFGQYTTAMSGLNLCKRKIVNNLTHNLCHFLFLTPDDIVKPERQPLSFD